MGVRRSPQGGNRGSNEPIFTYKSGSRTFDSIAELVNVSIRIVDISAGNAHKKTVEFITSKLPIRTGLFRNTMQRRLLQETKRRAQQEILNMLATRIDVLTNLKQKNIVKIDIKRIVRDVIAGVPYAVHHIDGKPHHPGDISPYENPTIDGTEPFDTAEFVERLLRTFLQEFKLEMEKRGMSWFVR